MIKRVKSILKVQSRTFAELADNVGMSRQSLHSTLSRNPTLSSITRIADALGVHPADLLRDPEPDPTPTVEPAVRCPHCGGVVELVKKPRD